MIEIWKPVKGYEGLYEVSNTGKIKSLEKFVDSGKCHRLFKEHLLKYGIDNKGYLRTNLAKCGINKTVKVHRIVAEAFILNPDNKPQVNHIDGDKQNNNVNNLEWVNQSENMKHAYINGLKSNKGSKNPASKLTREQVIYIRNNYKAKDKVFGAIPLALKFRVNRKTISRITTGRYWNE